MQVELGTSTDKRFNVIHLGVYNNGTENSKIYIIRMAKVKERQID